MLRRALWFVILVAACGEAGGAKRDIVQHAPPRSLAYPASSTVVVPRAAGPSEAVSGAPAAPLPQAIDKLHEEAIAELVERAIARGELPGGVVAIGNRTELLYLRAFGERTAGEPMTLDTLFDLASLTKPLATAASIMALVEQGAVELAAPVSRYLPELELPDKRDITVSQLLLHTSGLPRVNVLRDYEQGRAHALRMIARQPLRDAPGASFEYSDLGFILLGELVERVTGASLATFAQQRIYQPLGMRDTQFNPPEREVARSAPTEERDEHWIRGVVDDPRAYRLGGVAGHAGLFSTAADVATFAQMLLGRGERTGVRVLAEETVSRMLEPRRAGAAKRTLGFDVESRYSHARGLRFSERAVGHGGYTGTSLWLDPERELFVVLLSNRVHSGPRGSIHPLTSSVGDLAVRAVSRDSSRLSTGIDGLVQSAFAELRGRSVALLSHAAARDREGVQTLERLRRAPGVALKAVLTPEHGFDARQEGHVSHRRLGALPLYSLFGKQRKPTPEMLQGCDTIVVDLVDVGTRFYTYMASVLATLEAASELGLDVILLDRPNPIGGTRIEGPLSEEAFHSFVNFHPLPLRHGMTAGELARFLVAQRALDVRISIVRVQGWQREQWFPETGLVWHPPSPNLGSEEQAMLYPAIALVEGTNLSVGRGTPRAFQVLGAPFLNAEELARELTSSGLGFVRVEPTRFTPRVGPYAGQSIPGVSFELVDAQGFSAAQLGLELIAALRRTHAADWDSTRLSKMIAHRATLAALDRGAAPEEIEASWRDELKAFSQAREKALLY
jgi:uncharacterized protein YbbC (DUF1343 family)